MIFLAQTLSARPIQSETRAKERLSHQANTESMLHLSIAFRDGEKAQALEVNA
jgi:hypothetical protein